MGIKEGQKLQLNFSELAGKKKYTCFKHTLVENYLKKCFFLWLNFIYSFNLEISSLSIAHGGTEGGTLLKIAGSYFDETDAKPRVTIAGN